MIRQKLHGVCVLILVFLWRVFIMLTMCMSNHRAFSLLISAEMWFFLLLLKNWMFVRQTTDAKFCIKLWPSNTSLKRHTDADRFFFFAFTSFFGLDFGHLSINAIRSLPLTWIHFLCLRSRDAKNIVWKSHWLNQIMMMLQMFSASTATLSHSLEKSNWIIDKLIMSPLRGIFFFVCSIVLFFFYFDLDWYFQLIRCIFC